MCIVTLITGLFLLTLIGGYIIFSRLIALYGALIYMWSCCAAILLLALGFLLMLIDISKEENIDDTMKKRKHGQSDSK